MHKPRSAQSVAMYWTVLLVVLSQKIWSVNSVELTFELPDNARECFHEEIQKQQTATLEFQVSVVRK